MIDGSFEGLHIRCITGRKCKKRKITHLNATQGGGNQGSIFVPSPCTNLQYKLIDAMHKHDVENLIFPRNQTSQSAGYPVTSLSFSGEIDKLMNL